MTRFVPTMPGYYWMKHEDRVLVAHVELSEDWGDVLIVWIPGCEVFQPFVSLAADESILWAGPIAPPPDWVVPR